MHGLSPRKSERRIVLESELGQSSLSGEALHELSEKKVLELEEERKAAMVSNLLVVLCGESEAQPIINTGTLYT